MQVLPDALGLSRFASRRLRARLAMLAGALALSACSAVGGGKADVAGVAADAASLQQARAVALEAEVADLKEKNAALERQVAALQQKTAQDAAATAAAPTTPTAAVNPETVIATADAGRALANAPAKPVQSSPRLVQPTFASGQETVFENEAPGAIKMSSVLFGVHLASYRAETDARAGWRRLQRDNPDELGLLEPRIEAVKIEGRGDFLRLIGGGFSSQEKAAALCATLQAKGLYCGVTSFGGERLPLADTD
jgi:cell division protein FtsB